jgi:hypothetical protein
MRNAQGHLVPLANVRDIDLVRNDLVTMMVGKAKEFARQSEEFKAASFEAVTAFMEEARAKHKVRVGGDEGNVQLTSYDGRFRVIRASDKLITFTEGMTVAREIIFGFLKRLTDGADANLAEIVKKAFEVDGQGHLSASKVMGLFSYKIKDREWERAMKLIRESMQVTGSKTYIRFYERDAQGKYQQVALG